MKSILSVAIGFCLVALSLSLPLRFQSPQNFTLTALDDYVAREDPVFSFHELTASRIVETGYTVYILNVTTAQWLTSEFVDRYVWWHYAAVIVPTRLLYNSTGIVFIGGGKNTEAPPTVTDPDLNLSISLAVTTGTVTVSMYNVPNQPCTFTNDPDHKPRGEGDILAWTWHEFLEDTTTPEYLVWFPMTKSVHKVMDAVQEFARNFPASKPMELTQFVVAGASKRGWATWLTGITDVVRPHPRVIGIVPIVCDLLNLQKNMVHQQQALGGWSYVLHEYVKFNVTANLLTPASAAFARLTDPYEYRDRLANMPKLLVNAVGDEFFMLDDNHYFWETLPGPKWVHMVEDADHPLIGHEFAVVRNIQVFTTAILQHWQMPQPHWEIAEGSGDITLTVPEGADLLKVRLWHGSTLSAEQRDFRWTRLADDGDVIVQPIIWTDEDLSPSSKSANGTVYVAHQSMPRAGWRGFFIEMQFRGPTDVADVWQITTQVSIIPQTLPFPPCTDAQSCTGKLV